MSAYFPVKYLNREDGFFTGDMIRKNLTEENSGGAYSIRIEPDQCTITADRDGMFYAEDVLKEFNGRIPCGTIEEKPSLAVRCFHIDMKKGIGSLNELKKTILLLRELRINYILAEYENRIRYNCAPEVAEKDALTHDEVREFVRFASENGIHVIPLLQSLGHMEYLLSIEKYHHLSETPDTVTQYCPLNEESLNLFKAMAEELMELHPDAEYFHVGGDETRQLGKCPKCAEFVRQHSLLDLYFQRLNAVCSWFDSQGRKTLFWHDMLVRAKRFDLIAKLPKSAFPMYWCYQGNDEVDGRYFLEGNEGITISGKWLDEIHSFADFEKAPKGFSHINRDLPLKNTMFEGLAEICKVRSEVWGASATAVYRLLPNELIVRENIANWCTYAGKYHLKGIVITSWAADDSHSIAKGPRSLRHYCIALEAMKLWDSALTMDEIRERYDASYGCKGLTQILNIMVFSQPRETYCNWGEYGCALMDELKPTAHLEFFAKYHAAVQAEKLFHQADNCIRQNGMAMLTSIESAKKRARVNFTELRKRLLASEAELKKVFADEFSEEVLEEWLNSLYAPKLIEVDGYLNYRKELE